MKIYFLSLIFIFTIAACSGGAPTTVDVYVSKGSKQCDGGGIDLLQKQSQLTDAGIVVLSSSCGNDGASRMTLCGSPNGNVLIYTISENQLELALSSGLNKLSELSNASKGACQ